MWFKLSFAIVGRTALSARSERQSKVNLTIYGTKAGLYQRQVISLRQEHNSLIDKPNATYGPTDIPNATFLSIARRLHAMDQHSLVSIVLKSLHSGVILFVHNQSCLC